MVRENQQILIRFGKHLATLRKSKNLSYRKLAQLCNIEFADLKRYENGEINMTFISLVQLAEALNVSLAELMNF